LLRSSGSCNATLTESTATSYTGSCTIDSETAGEIVTATYDADGGDANYVEAISNNLTVRRADQAALSITSTTGAYGTPLHLTTSGGSGTGTVSYALDAGGNASGCSIVSGVLSATSAGTCSVTATKAADANYKRASSPKTTVTFGLAPQAALTLTTTSGPYGTPLTLATTGGSDGGAVGFVVDSGGSASGCSITSGVLKVTSVGTCFVTATMAGNDDYLPVSSAQTMVTFVSTSATLAGQITDATTGGGIANACVEVITPTGIKVAVVIASSSGDFSTTVTPGSYKLIGFDSGCVATTHAPTYFGGAPEYAILAPDASTVTVAAGTDDTALDIALPEAGSITGSVVTSGDTPVGGICAYAIDPETEQLGAYAETSPTGSYTITGLPPSTYVVAFTACLTGSDPFALAYAPNAPSSTAPSGNYTVTANASTTADDDNF
jgi:hypothetical protein